MAKTFVVLCVAIAGVLAEPPSSYLPPQARNSPATQYGAPVEGFNGGSRRVSTSFHSQRTGSQSFSYNSHHGSSGSSFKGAGHGTFGSSRKSSFGGRSFTGTARGTFAAPAPVYSVPAPTYSAPASTYSVPSQSFSAPSPTYGAPTQGFSRGFSNGASAGHGSFTSFGASSSSSHTFASPAQTLSTPSSQYGPPSTQYGPPSTRYGAPFGKKMDEDLSEPANYEYRYQVLAGDESGAEFGHQESRENEAAKGQYHVLLPDGRMQIVEYEADEEGFRPNIRYEETGAYPAARSNDYNGLEGPY